MNGTHITAKSGSGEVDLQSLWVTVSHIFILWRRVVAVASTVTARLFMSLRVRLDVRLRVYGKNKSTTRREERRALVSVECVQFKPYKPLMRTYPVFYRRNGGLRFLFWRFLGTKWALCGSRMWEHVGIVCSPVLRGLRCTRTQLWRLAGSFRQIRSFASVWLCKMSRGCAGNDWKT